MRLLLDTYVLLWALGDPRRLGRRTQQDLQRSQVFVSVASLWEISIKASLGKLDADPELVASEVEAAGFDLLDIRAPHATRVFSLRRRHPDPFDRMLIAQADIENLQLLTRDESLLAYGPMVRLA